MSDRLARATGSRVVVSYQCEKEDIWTAKRPDLAGADAPCAIDVSRQKVNDITIERWEIDGKVLVDVSQKTSDPKKARGTFRTLVVEMDQALLARAARGCDRRAGVPAEVTPMENR